MGDRETVSSFDLNLYTDASAKGAGIVLGKWWQQILFPTAWGSMNIAILELYPIVVAVDTFHAHMCGKRVLFHSNNMAIVHVLNAKTARDKDIMVLVRRLVKLCLRYDIVFEAVHIRGVDNFLPGCL